MIPAYRDSTPRLRPHWLARRERQAWNTRRAERALYRALIFRHAAEPGSGLPEPLRRFALQAAREEAAVARRLCDRYRAVGTAAGLPDALGTRVRAAVIVLLTLGVLVACWHQVVGG